MFVTVATIPLIAKIATMAALVAGTGEAIVLFAGVALTTAVVWRTPALVELRAFSGPLPVAWELTTIFFEALLLLRLPVLAEGVETLLKKGSQ